MFQVNENGLLILTDELGELLTRVQRRGNSEVTYQTDAKTYGYENPEKWSYPKEDGTRLVGDCEDISIYKHRLLVEAGVPLAPLLLTICKDPNGGGHCVLCVCTENKDFIMCNNHEVLVVPRTMIREGYTFLYRQGFGRKVDEPWDVLK